jgi:NitT/TauT family transport system substrate-binding protein
VKRSLFLAAVLTAAASLSWGAGTAQLTQPQTVRLAIGYIPHLQFTPLYVGVDKGFYKDEGIDLQLSFGYQYDVFSLLAAGKIDIGLSDSCRRSSSITSSIPSPSWRRRTSSRLRRT